MVTVRAGDGNDVVDRRGDADPLAAGATNLGSGTNSFYGAAAGDLVDTAAGASDTIATGDGSDTVFASYAGFGTAEVDSIDLGAGDDVVTFQEGLSTGLTLSGGEGDDTLWVEDAPPGAWTIDAVAGQIVARPRCTSPSPASTPTDLQRGAAHVRGQRPRRVALLADRDPAVGLDGRWRRRADVAGRPGPRSDPVRRRSGPGPDRLLGSSGTRSRST